VPIQSFGDVSTELFFITGRVGRRAGWMSVAGVVRRKLDILHYASGLSDLAAFRGNRLELLRGRLRGYHSIRVNARWRVVFRWTDRGPSEVRVIDYH